LITFSTNIGEVYGDFNRVVKQAGDADKVLRTVADNSLVLIIDRVQQQGLKTDGSKLQTKSKKRYGAYSEYYGEKVRSPKYRTDQVDLTLTGDMFSDFVAEPTGEREYSVGFRGEKSASKAEFAEDYYGEIFAPSDEEEEFLLAILDRKLNEIFK
jgi:hypothetical protein